MDTFKERTNDNKQTKRKYIAENTTIHRRQSLDMVLNGLGVLKYVDNEKNIEIMRK